MPGFTYGFKRGDANDDNEIIISDPSRILNFLFIGQPPPPCMDAADSNNNEVLDLSDAVYLLSFPFLGGPQPPPPFPDFGLDPDGGEALGCEN